MPLRRWFLLRFTLARPLRCRDACSSGRVRRVQLDRGGPPFQSQRSSARRSSLRLRCVVLNWVAWGRRCQEIMPETVSAEIIFCRERARLAREKAETASTVEGKDTYLAAEARWIALARSYDLHGRLSKALGERTHSIGAGPGFAFEPEVVAILSSAFHAVFAELGLSDRDEFIGLRVARRIIELAARGERNPERLKAVVLAWVQEAHL
jgi:hypothetical protein